MSDTNAAVRGSGHPQSRAQPIRWDYSKREMLADGCIHALGLAFAVLAVAILLAASLFSEVQGVTRAALIVYTAGLLAMIGFSAAYNMWPVGSVKWMLRRFDHSAIYLLIVGTYTVFAVNLPPDAALYAVLIFVWCAALIGIGMKLFLPGKLDRVSIFFVCGYRIQWRLRI